MLNWTGNKIQALFTCTIFLLCYSILIGHSLGPQSSLDTYWHLQMGVDFLENGLSPWVDHYSFTFTGKEISSVPFLFQITIATYVSIFGEEAGFIAFKITYVTLLLFVIYQFFRKIKAPWFIISIILPILIYFINMRLIVRPDVISNILAIICLTLYLNARENFGTKELLSICLLLLFWVNYHTPILGYIIIFGLFLDRAISKITYKDNNFTWSQWSAWAAIIFMIGFINPTFDHVIILIFSLSNEWYQHLSEYAPSYIAYSTDKMVYLSLFASIFAVFLATIKKHYGLAFIVVLLGYYAWSISRLLPAVSLINLCVFALLISQIDYNKFFTNIKIELRIAVIFITVSLFIFTIFQTAENTVNRLQAIRNFPLHVQYMQKQTEKKFPFQITDYLNSFHNGGDVLNTFNTGGYLIHTLSPDYKIFIDGRTNILYPVSFYKHYLDLLNNIDTLETDVKKYGIEYAIFENTPRAHHYFQKTDLLKINFANDNYILFSKKNAITFPLASKLTLYPMCWQDRFSDKALTEIHLSNAKFSEKEYTIKYILNFLDKYLSNKNRQQFINALKIDNFSSDITKRLAAYIAIHKDDFQTANTLFTSITTKNSDDLLMLSYALMMTEEYLTSKSILAYYLNTKGGLNKEFISDFDKSIIIKILTAILEKSNSNDLASFDIDKIKDELGINNSEYIQSLSPGLPYNDVCNEIFKF